MAELLLELFSEEIPARMQAEAAQALRKQVGDALARAGIAEIDARTFVTPRRLTLTIDGLPTALPDVVEERRGPRADAPAAAIEGFLKSAGISLERCERRDTPKGTFLFARIDVKGRPAADLLKDAIEAALSNFPWPKAMRWGNQTQRWVRPLHSILCLFDGAVVPVSYAGVEAGNATFGHRFLAPARLVVADYAEYAAKLRQAHVVIDAEERKTLIRERAKELARAEGLKVKDDPGLLSEVAGLVEWPAPLLGRIDADSMVLPDEVLSTAMRTHQKYFSLLEPDGRLAARFVAVANMETADGGARIVAGNERVLRARLADARFFWDHDRRTRLCERTEKLKERTFYQGLGTMFDKGERLRRLAAFMAGFVPGAEAKDVDRAAFLAKADLSSGMVGEFPELQGTMGRYYALNDGESAAVADAVADHYRPQGPSDVCPSRPVSVVTALADRIDTLAGFWALGEKPTGSKDPFALRRAALGVMRLLLENGVRTSLRQAFVQAMHGYGGLVADPAALSGELLDFFLERLKVHLRERGVRHDLVAAVLSLGGEDDPVRLSARVSALASFVESEAGGDLLAAYRRAANIVRIEEKKDAASHGGAVDASALSLEEEKELHEALAAAGTCVAAALEKEDFVAAMEGLARLRGPVDRFFDGVTVNADDAFARGNRLRLLAGIGAVMERIADFSVIEG